MANEILNLDKDLTQKIVDLESQLKFLKEQESALKTKLLQAFEDSGTKSIENKELKITYVLPTIRKTFDSKKFEEENEELYNKYVRETAARGSVKITLRDTSKKPSEIENFINNADF